MIRVFDRPNGMKEFSEDRHSMDHRACGALTVPAAAGVNEGSIVQEGAYCFYDFTIELNGVVLAHGSSGWEMDNSHNYHIDLTPTAEGMPYWDSGDEPA